MISRVVPRPEPDPLVIVAEDYNEWTARAEAFKGAKPAALTALELVDNQTARLERKLFIHNGGHAVCGYFGFHRGHEFIHEAVADPVVPSTSSGALDEIGEVVERKHGFSAESIDAYKRDLCRRGAIAEMRDEILRVVRDPIRKLSPANGWWPRPSWPSSTACRGSGSSRASSPPSSTSIPTTRSRWNWPTS